VTVLLCVFAIACASAASAEGVTTLQLVDQIARVVDRSRDRLARVTAVANAAS